MLLSIPPLLQTKRDVLLLLFHPLTSMARSFFAMMQRLFGQKTGFVHKELLPCLLTVSIKRVSFSGYYALVKQRGLETLTSLPKRIENDLTVSSNTITTTIIARIKSESDTTSKMLGGGSTQFTIPTSTISSMIFTNFRSIFAKTPIERDAKEEGQGLLTVAPPFSKARKVMKIKGLRLMFRVYYNLRAKDRKSAAQEGL